MCAVLVAVCATAVVAPEAALAQRARPSVRLSASPAVTAKRQAITLSVSSVSAAHCRLSAGASGKRTVFPLLKTDAKGRGAVRWQLPRHAPRGVWRFVATCSKRGRRTVRRDRSRIAIKGSRGTGGLVARSSAVALRGTFRSTGVRGGSSSCAPGRDGKPVCFTGNPFLRQAGQATWYASGRRPDLTGIVRGGSAARWLAQARGHLPVGDKPVVGAIAVWAPGADGSDPVRGHVAFVAAVAADGKSVSVDEANWVPGLVTTGRKVAVSRIGGYIYGGAAGGGTGGGGTPLPGDADGDGVPDASDACPTIPAVGGCPAGAQFLSGDLNMNNRDDLVVVTPRGGGRPSGANYSVLTAAGTALTHAGVWGGADDVDIPRAKFEVGDVNNDSREDLLVVTPKRDATPSGATFTILLSNGTRLTSAGAWGAPDDVDVATSEFQLGDATNDGRDDLFVVSSRPGGVTYSVWTSNGTTLNNGGVWLSSDNVSLAASRFLVGDVNLDGRDDVVAVTPRRGTAPSGANYNVLLSTGSALNSAGVWSFSEDVDIAGSRFDIGDANADDRADVFAITPRRASAPSGANYAVLTSTGSALNAGSPWAGSDSVDLAKARFLAADVTGDARKDLLVAGARRDTRPTGAAYNVLTSSGSALSSPASWGSSDDADIDPAGG